MQREVVIITGQTGAGKSSLARRMFDETPRAFLVDADFKEFRCTYYDDYTLFVQHLSARGAFSDFRTPPGRLSYVPFRVGYTPLSSEHGLVFDTAAELGNLTLFLEEADRFADPGQLPEYDEVITRGRHYGVSIVAISTHPFGLPKELRRQATRIIAFHQEETSDLDYLANRIGEAAYTLPKLPKFSYLDWAPFAPIQKITLDKP